MDFKQIRRFMNQSKPYLIPDLEIGYPEAFHSHTEPCDNDKLWKAYDCFLPYESLNIVFKTQTRLTRRNINIDLQEALQALSLTTSTSCSDSSSICSIPQMRVCRAYPCAFRGIIGCHNGP